MNTKKDSKSNSDGLFRYKGPFVIELTMPISIDAEIPLYLLSQDKINSVDKSGEIEQLDSKIFILRLQKKYNIPSDDIKVICNLNTMEIIWKNQKYFN